MNKTQILSKIFFALMVIQSGGGSVAQSVFQKNYINLYSAGFSIVAEENGFVIAGANTGSVQTGKDVYILKTDPDGAVLWAKTIGGSKDDIAYAIKKTSDDGYIVAGSTSSYVSLASDSSNFYVVKVDFSGNVLWTRAIGSYAAEAAYDVIETYDNKYAIVGTTRSIGPGNEDVFFIELDSNGDLLWAYGMGSSGSDFGNSLIQTENNGFIIVGSTTGFTAEGQMPYLIKTSELGILQNPTYTFDLNTTYTTQKQYFTKIIEGYFNDLVITGSDGLGSIGDAQHFILSLSQDIAVNWMKKYYLNSGEGVGMALDKTTDGGFIIGGTMGYDRPALIKTDGIGQLLTTMFYSDLNGAYFGKGLDVSSTNDDGFVLLGYRHNASDTSTYLIRTNDALSSGCEEQTGFLNTSSAVYPTVNIETSSYSTGTLYIAIDSGTVENSSPFTNTICFTTGMDQTPITKKELRIQQSASTIYFKLNEGNDQIFEIQILNAVGEIILKQKGNNISTVLFPRGVYIYKAVTNRDQYTGKFIID